MIIQSPCYNPDYCTDCPNRFAGCHSVCERWQVYEQAKVMEYNKRKARQENLDVSCGYLNKSKLRNERRNRNK